jgi:hypothetical protein
VEKYGTAGQETKNIVIRRMSIACNIPKATVTHSEYVTLIAFPRQQCLHESASIARYTYDAFLVRVNVAISLTKVSTVPLVPTVTKCPKVFRYADIFWHVYTKNLNDEVQIKSLNTASRHGEITLNCAC